MKIAQITPGLIEIPPKKWGAIEKIIWNYKLEFEKKGNVVDILYLDDAIKNYKKYDVIHIHIANLCNKLIEYKIPYYFTLHDHHVVLLDSEFNRNKIAIENAKKAFVPAKYLVDLFNNIPYYIPHGIDLELYNNSNLDYVDVIDQPKLLCVGNNIYSHSDNHDRKGFSYAIEAAINLNLEITIAGPYNENKSNKQFFENYSHLLKYEKLNIIKNPTEDELIKLYCDHDIFIHPSELEAGHPNLTLLEAASCGLPIVGTIEDNYNGIYRVYRNDSLNLVSSIMKGIEHIRLNYNKYMYGALKFAKNHSWDIITNIIYNYYNENENNNSMKEVLLKEYNSDLHIERNINNEFFYAKTVNGDVEKFYINDLDRKNLDPAINSMYHEIFTDKIYDKHIPINKDSVVLDIGANIGLFGLYSSIKGAKKIISIEPESYNFNLLKKNRPKNTILYHRAVTDVTNDTVDLYIDSTLGGHSVIEADINNTKTGDYQSVTTINIDDIIRENNLSKIDIVKIDTEGSEDIILNGISSNNYKKINHVVMEYHHMKYDFDEDKLKGIIHELDEFGFDLKEIINLGDNNHLKLMYFTNRNFDISNKNDLEINVNYNFINGAFVEVKGESSNKNKFNVVISDDITKEIIYTNTININHWVKANRQYYVPYKIEVFTANTNKLLFTKKINLSNKNVLITLDSSSLGDTLAWFPYAEEFRKKYNCNVYISTFWNDLFDTKFYNKLIFVERGKSVPNIYAQYSVGIHGDGLGDKILNPMDTRKVPLQKIATEYLNLEYTEIKPVLKYKRTEDKVKNNKVTFAIHSTSQSKYWNNNSGWKDVSEYLNSKGIRPVLISKENSGYMGNYHPPKNIIVDKSGDYSIEDRIHDILESKFFMGISSGLSWLSWALDTPTILISGFTDPWFEPSKNVYRVHNSNVCHGCWHRHIFDKGDWNWCPDHKGTDRQFECSKSITPDMIIDTIKSNNLIL